MWSFSTENLSFPNQSQHPAQFYWNLSFKVTVPCVLVRLDWCFEHCQVNLCSVWLLFHFWQISINPTDEVSCFNLLTLRPGKWIFSTSMIELCCLCTLKHTLICWHHCSFFFFPRRFYNMQAVTGKSCAENIFLKSRKYEYLVMPRIHFPCLPTSVCFFQQCPGSYWIWCNKSRRCIIINMTKLKSYG